MSLEVEGSYALLDNWLPTSNESGDDFTQLFLILAHNLGHVEG